jgi:hypothetical protein
LVATGVMTVFISLALYGSAGGFNFSG